MNATASHRDHNVWTPSEHTMTLWDGTELFYRAWNASPAAKQAVLLFHRGHEHSGRLQDLVERLALDGIACFAWDARGHGRTPGKRGHAESFDAMVQDMECFARTISRDHQITLEDMAVVANSVGAVVAATWVHDYAPPLRAMVLAAPAFEVNLYVPLAVPGLKALNQVREGASIKSYVRAEMLTHDPEMARAYRDDDLIARDIAVHILLGLRAAAKRIIDDAQAIKVPMLVLSAGKDWVVKQAPQKRFVERLGSAEKALEVYEGFYHSIFSEKERQRPIDRTRAFILEAFGGDPFVADPHDPAAPSAPSALTEPLPPLSPKGLGFATQKLAMKTVGKLSDGIRLGWESGFNSGQTLDYVYANQASGASFVGRLLDRAYLDSVGWRGIRHRRAQLTKLLLEAVETAQEEGRTTVLDVAAGGGGYLFDALKTCADPDTHAIVCDQSEGALAVARRNAHEASIESAEFQVRDAFDGADLATLDGSIDVAVVSGLYELFPDNEMVAASLSGLSKAVRAGGTLVYTNQPWHPQQEMIARVLVGFDGKPWAMRCRSQHEMDALVAAAGFEKIASEVGEAGIFTVSLARRKSA